jgi:PAS domain S-box-containing protein
MKIQLRRWLGQLKASLTNPRGAAIGITLIVFVVLMAGWYFAAQAYATLLMNEQRDSVVDLLTVYAPSLSSAFNQRLGQVKALAAFANLHATELDGQPNQEFDTFAGGLYSLSPGIQALAIMPDGIASYVYPVMGNEKLQGENMLQGQPSDVKADIQRAIQSRQQVISEPQVQPHGGLDLVSYLAIYQGDAFWGLAAVDLQVSQIFQSLGIHSEESGLSLAVRTQMGSPVLGDMRVFDANPEDALVPLPDGNWTLAAIPTGGWDAAINGQLFIFRLITLLVVLVVLPSTYYYARRRFALSSAFRQQTEVLAQTVAGKQEIESSLRAREERYFNLFNSMQDPVFVYLLEEDATPGPFLEVNDAACRLLGYARDELMAKSRLDFVPVESRPALLGEIRKTVRGEVGQFESELIAKDGSHYAVESKGQAYVSGGKTYIVAITRDITERKKAEETLLRQAQIMNQAHEGIVATDLNGLIVSWNSAAEKLLGYSAEEALDKPISFVFPQDQLSILTEEIQPQVRKKGWHETEVRFRSKSGKEFPVHLILTALKDNKGGVVGLAGSAIDITERKKAETELKNLNRALRMIGECNQVLVRAQDEQRLLVDICKIVTEAGGYRMAWVGYAEQDEAQTVRPVTSAGFEEGYLESPIISWADVPHGQGPTGTAIRTKEPVICSDFQTDPRLLPWRAEAARRGYRSSIALPLLSGEQCLGALTLYSAEANRFVEGEEKLLIELANDLAYGITALRARVQHEKDLAEIENLSRFPGENPSPVLRVNSDGKVLYSNAAGRALLKEWKVSKTGVVSPVWRKRIANVLDSRRAEMVEVKLGERVMEVWMEPIQGRSYVNLYGRDITETKQAEEALRESEDKFKYVFDYSVIGKSITSIGGELHVNKAFCDMLGYSVEELQNKKWQEITYPDDIEMNQRALDLVMSGEQESARLTKRYIKKDSSIMWGDLSTALRRDSEGNPLYYFTSLIDITERKNAEDRIRELNAGLEQRVKERTAQLEAINRELETFTYSVSHDLKAPLRGIDGYSQLLLEDYQDKLDENGQTFLKNIRSATENMNRLIQDLLAYSRMERRSYASAEVDIHPLVESLLSERRDELASKGIQMVVDIPFEQVQADIDGISAVLRNLLDNAIKFTSKAEHPRIEVGGEEKANVKLLWVRDNGIGFEMQYAERIFEIFQRLQRAEDYPGTGVGLAIVNKAMQRMGGRVWAESELGKGATFYLEFRRTV